MLIALQVVRFHLRECIGSSSPLLAKTIPYLGLESLKTHTHTYIHYPKIVYALLNKTVSLMSYYSLPANSITPSLLMKIALIRGNCLSLSVSCYIGVLHHSIHPALPWRILRINSLAFLLTSLLLFELNWNQTLSRIFIYLMKSL